MRKLPLVIGLAVTLMAANGAMAALPPLAGWPAAPELHIERAGSDVLLCWDGEELLFGRYWLWRCPNDPYCSAPQFAAATRETAYRVADGVPAPGEMTTWYVQRLTRRSNLVGAVSFALQTVP
jgi:hypothetical protein